MSTKSLKSIKIYKILNKANHKVYIGQTMQTLKERLKHHIKPSAKSCFLLKRAINKYGSNCFEIHEIEEVISVEEANLREIYWISHYKSTDPNFGYNRLKGGRSWSGTHSEKTKKKLSLLNTGPNNPNYGKKLNKEHKNKIAASNKGKKQSEETKKKLSLLNMGAKNPNYGKSKSHETKKKMSESQKGKKRNQIFFSKKVICLNNGIVYSSIREASFKLKLSKNHISRVCRGKIPSLKGYKFEYFKDPQSL